MAGFYVRISNLWKKNRRALPSIGNAATTSPRFLPGGYGEVLRIAWPLMVSTGSFTVMQFVDRIFLSWHSPVSIQAAFPAGVLAFTLIAAFMAVAGYAGTFVAQYHGAGEPEGCSRATAQGLWIALFSWPVMLALIPLGRALLRGSGHPPAVLAEELRYFTILMTGSLAIPLGAAASGFFTGRGDTLTNMLAQVAGNAVNVVLDYLLIFGKAGLPRMGIDGAGWATAAAGFVAPALLIALFLSRRHQEAYRTRRRLRLDPHLCLRVCRFGLPSGVQLFLDVASFTAFVLFTGRMGERALTASNIAFAINLVAFMPLVGLGMAASILVGQYQGRGDHATAARATWNTYRLGVAYMLAVGATYVLLPRPYFALFMPGGNGGPTLDEILGLGRWLLVLMAVWGPLDAANLILAGALKGAGDTRFVMIYQLLMSWLLLVPVQALLVWRGHGILASWGWLTAYVMLLSVGYFLRFVRGRWQEIRMIEDGGEGAGSAVGSALD